MSLVNPSSLAREHPLAKPLQREPAVCSYSSAEPYDETIYDEFYDSDVVAPSPPPKAQPSDAPALPQKSVRRPSHMLDSFDVSVVGSLKVPATDAGRVTPHDMYLSSEEDASSSAGEFSEYDYDSSDESYAPSRRGSQEDTARVVNVVFSGKPCIVDLTLARHRSVSPTSAILSRRDSDMSSSKSPDNRPSTPASSILSAYEPHRKNTMLRRIRPPFLRIDPLSSGSPRPSELAASPEEADEDEEGGGAKVHDGSPARQAKTPTGLRKGMSRTISLVRKRSRPLLTSFAPSPPPARDSAASPVPPRTASAMSQISYPVLQREPSKSDAYGPLRSQSPLAARPLTSYSDIMTAARKTMVLQQLEHQELQALPTPPSPTAPARPGSRRGILSGLAARRRSVKVIGRVI